MTKLKADDVTVKILLVDDHAMLREDWPDFYRNNQILRSAERPAVRLKPCSKSWKRNRIL